MWGRDYTLFSRPKQTRQGISAHGYNNLFEPWENYLDFGDTSLTTNWRHYEITANATGGDPAAGFHLGLGQTTGSVWLDDVHLNLDLNLGSRNVWRHDYENGIFLVNSTEAAHTIDLGDIFQKINGPGSGH